MLWIEDGLGIPLLGDDGGYDVESFSKRARGSRVDSSVIVSCLHGETYCLMAGEMFSEIMYTIQPLIQQPGTLSLRGLPYEAASKLVRKSTERKKKRATR